jgi:hypothetical protein
VVAYCRVSLLLLHYCIPIPEPKGMSLFWWSRIGKGLRLRPLLFSTLMFNIKICNDWRFSKEISKYIMCKKKEKNLWTFIAQCAIIKKLVFYSLCFVFLTKWNEIITCFISFRQRKLSAGLQEYTILNSNYLFCMFHGHFCAFLTLPRPLHGPSRPWIFHGPKRFSAATFEQRGRDDGHLATLRLTTVPVVGGD